MRTPEGVRILPFLRKVVSLLGRERNNFPVPQTLRGEPMAVLLTSLFACVFVCLFVGFFKIILLPSSKQESKLNYLCLLLAELQLQFRHCISAFHLLSHLFLLSVSLLSIVSSVSQFIQFSGLASHFSIITVLMAVRRAEKLFAKWFFSHSTSALALVGFCLCLVLHVVSSGKRGDVCIMCILLELFNFCKHLHSAARGAFRAETDCSLKQRRKQRVDTMLAVSGSLEELENR